jgi:hypothetical protein
MTLDYLRGFDDVGSLMVDAQAREPRQYETQMARAVGGMAAVWDGDAAYGTDDPDTPGPRYRLWMLEDGWRLEDTTAST